MSNSDTEELKSRGRDNEELSEDEPSEEDEIVNKTASEVEDEERREERMRRHRNEERRQEKMRRQRDDNPDDDDYTDTDKKEEAELASQEHAALSDADETAAEETAAEETGDEVVLLEKSEKDTLVDKIAKLERLLKLSKEEVVEIDIKEIKGRPWWTEHPDFPLEWHDRPRCNINPPMTPTKEDSPVNIFMFNLCARGCCIKLNRRRWFASERRRRTSTPA